MLSFIYINYVLSAQIGRQKLHFFGRFFFSFLGRFFVKLIQFEILICTFLSYFHRLLSAQSCHPQIGRQELQIHLSSCIFCQTRSLNMSRRCTGKIVIQNSIRHSSSRIYLMCKSPSKIPRKQISQKRRED